MKKCGKKYALLSSLRNHCRIAHKTKISSIKRQSARLYQQYRVQKRFEKRGGRNEIYDIKDFDLGLVEVGQSTIPNAGRGVFATRNLKRGDIVTEYAGQFVLNEPDDKEYTLQVKGGFIDGERNPTSSASLGSLINREYRNYGVLSLRKNIVLKEIGHRRAVAKVIKKIKPGQELITTYSRQYRNKLASQIAKYFFVLSDTEPSLAT